MAFHKTLAHRFLHIAKTCSSHLRPNGSSFLPRKTRPGIEDGLVRRFLHKRPVPPDRIAVPMGDDVMERIRSIGGSRIRLDCLFPPPIPKEEAGDDGRESSSKISMAEVRKVLKAAQMEMARSKLREMERDQISYAEFVKVCGEVSNSDQGSGIAKALDESGAVIVLGNVVFLRPDQVAKAIERAIPLSTPHKNECQKEELREMEEKKAVIDKLAKDEVKRESWCALGFMVVQTLGLMRLTFWELSWDVMEPICFYLTSFYFLGGYTYFLKTSKEPTFESFFQSRFASKQKRLMKAYNFDPLKFDQLKRGCTSQASLATSEVFAFSTCDCNRREMQIGIVH